MKNMSEGRKHYRDILKSMPNEEEYFLERWSVRMEQAGYLQHTTAKRVDCLQALNDFLSPMIAHWEMGGAEPDFPWLIRHENEWGKPQIESARRHRMRGITSDMYLGCFKTFIHSLMDVIEKMDASYETKVQARRHAKLYGDALEVLFVRDWTKTLPDMATRELDHANRLLTLEKCRFENILNATSDLILVVDSEGVVTNVNEAVKAVVDEKDVMGVPVWDALVLEGQSVEDLLKYYPIGMSCEMSPFDDDIIYRLQINSIGNVSMASDEYMIMLTNITAHATQRETLERVVSERTEALRQEKEQLEEMNITLRNVLQSIDKEREDLLGEVTAKVNNFVLPALDRIENEEDAGIRKGYLTVAKDQLARLAPGSASSEPGLLKLTHMETRVCQFIQAGHSSKDIANSLNLSIETVQTHRKNIRRKLGLHGKSVSLYAHLKRIGLSN
ncbi:Regulatory protein LuxR [Pseudodesulfovibrio profundus]|uniref:Regulatory protein LuxR n=1 Tax=Pseudodesulfovibrio profundus TaxID=57320 RepID=A0A2C8FC95_9BACT|nr:LuxR C-terminal-related transcriptional regulator [Pseudodesulfovibrio profundus]SOB60404.1 Regulatory protein LuxR [Pseudodesulfovibrio profundus]